MNSIDSLLSRDRQKQQKIPACDSHVSLAPCSCVLPLSRLLGRLMDRRALERTLHSCLSWRHASSHDLGRQHWVLQVRSPSEANGNLIQYFFSGKSHRQRSLVGYSPGGPKSFRHDLATKQQQQLETECNNKSKNCDYIGPFNGAVISFYHNSHY